MMLAHRSQDAVIAVYQDNAKRDIIIHDVNPAAAAVLGYSEAEIKGKSIALILPPRIFSLISEFVEYEPDGNDVGSVLNKVPSFCLVSKSREEIDFRLKISRTTPAGGHDQFALMLLSAQHNRRTEAFRTLLQENFKGHEVLDEATGLANRQSIIKDVEYVLFYVHKKELAASVAVIELDDYAALAKSHSPAIIAKIFKHMAQLCKQNLRTDDAIGYLEPKRLGLILLDTASESAHMVLNRLRWLIAAHPFIDAEGQTLNVRVSIAFHCLTESVDDKESLEKLEAAMDANKVANNNVQEIFFED